MSAAASPFGLRPAFSPMGIIRPTTQRTVLTAYATGILQNQPVKIGTDGTLQAAAIGDRFVGAFGGVQYVDATGRPIVQNQWTASTTATDIVAWCEEDPTLYYEIQANATLNVANIGEQYNFTTVSTGSTTTGLSQTSLDVSTTAANAQMQLMGLRPAADNNWGDAFPIVLVRISKHQFVADIAAF